MAEKIKCNKLQKEPQQVKQVMKEPQGKAMQPPSGVQPAQQVTTKNPKKVEAGKRLAAHNHKKRKEQRKEQTQLEKRGVNQYYRIGAVLALGVIGGLGYYIYQSRKGPAPSEVMMPASQQQPCPQA